jgi:hypothetical protein
MKIPGEQLKRMRRFLGISVCALLLLSGCHRPPAESDDGGTEGPAWFADITHESGLGFVHDPGPPPGKYFMPQIMGSGAALFDYDNDGRLDIYLVQNGGPRSGSRNRLFHQGPDGRFTDVSTGSGLDVAGFGMGVAIADVNNDGWPDVFLTEYGRSRLFLNNGNGTFTDVTHEAGLDNPLWGTSAAFFDYDRDGWLDLVVVNYVDYDPSLPCGNAGGRRDYCHPSSFPGCVTRLYRNLGAGTASGPRVRFEDVTIRSGLGRLPGPGLGVVCGDFTGDGWPDIFVANDSQPNRLWINQRDGTFKEEAMLRGVAYNALGQTQANMGIALGDVRGNGLADLFVTHLTEETNTLWQQQPAGMFQDATQLAGLAGGPRHGTGFGTVFGDFDQDGALDLALVNGRVAKRKEAEHADGSFWARYAERNQLYANDGSGRFREVSAANPGFAGYRAVSRGLCCGDIDGDGALDLLVTELGGPARLFRNVAPQRGHWLLLRVIDPTLHRDAYGAVVTVHAGGKQWLRLVNPAYSYLCSNDPRVHIGLGKEAQIDRIEVRWPDGAAETFPGGRVDRVLELRKGDGRR